MQSPVISQVLFTEPLLLLESGLFIPNTMDVAKPSKSSTPTVLLNRPTALCCRKCPHRGHRLGLLISEETICPGLPHQIILASTILIKPDMNIQEHWFSNPTPPHLLLSFRGVISRGREETRQQPTLLTRGLQLCCVNIPEEKRKPALVRRAQHFPQGCTHGFHL